jgi:hypothetical protein
MPRLCQFVNPVFANPVSENPVCVNPVFVNPVFAALTCAPAHHRYCLLSRSSLRVSESQLTAASPDAYATMSDDMVMVHAAVELGHKVSRKLRGFGAKLGSGAC